MTKCACGCGGEIIHQEHHKYYGTPEYINGHQRTGKKSSDETRAKISASNMGRIGWNKGKTGVYSEETLKKMSESSKGHEVTDETKKKISNANNGQVPWNAGKKGVFSEETLRQMSETQKGIKHTDESKRKISEAGKGKKHTEETKRKMSGKNNPRWKGGISFLPYCDRFNDRLKEHIRERDGRICQRCSKNEEENDKRLTVHHIHYDKENCYPDLIALCVSCNSTVNQNRDYWEQHFMEMLGSRGLAEMPYSQYQEAMFNV